VTTQDVVVGHEPTHDNPLINDHPTGLVAAGKADPTSQHDRRQRRFQRSCNDCRRKFNVLGTLIAGKQGIGKVIARAIRQLLPPTILRVKGSPYDMDSSGEGGLDGLLLQEMI